MFENLKVNPKNQHIIFFCHPKFNICCWSLKKYYFCAQSWPSNPPKVFCFVLSEQVIVGYYSLFACLLEIRRSLFIYFPPQKKDYLTLFSCGQSEQASIFRIFLNILSHIWRRDTWRRQIYGLPN